MAILAPLWCLGTVSAVIGKQATVLWTHRMKPHPRPSALLKYSVNVQMI